MLKVIKENAGTYNRTSNGKTGLRSIEDGRVSKEISSNELINYFTKDSSIDYDVDLGIVINSLSDQGGKSAVLDWELIDDQNRSFKKAHDAIQIALREGEMDTANLLIGDLMKALYMKFNTLEKVQGNTTSKDI